MKKIVILGASNSQNPLIQKAKEMGYETHVFAWKTGDIGERTADYFYPISIMNVDEVYAKCLEIGPVGVITIASDHAALAAQQVSARLGLTANSERAMRSMTNKLVMHQLLDGQVAQAAYCEVNDQLDDKYYDNLRYPCIVKPADRTGGRGVRIVHNRRELVDAIAYARDMSFERKAIIEEYLEGAEYSCEAFSYQGKHRIVAYTKVRRLPAGGGILHGEYAQPVYFQEALKAQIDAMVIKALDIFGLEYGPSHLEFVVTPEGAVKLLEVSPTIGGDGVGALLTPASTGCDYLKLVIQAMCRELSVGEDGNFLPEMEPMAGITAIKLVNSPADHQRFLELSALADSPVAEASGMEGLSAQDMGLGLKKYGYYLVKYPAMEMGSYLPLETAAGETPFDSYPREQVLGANSIKTALLLALRCLEENTVYVPYLYSPTLTGLLEKNGYRVERYHIGEDLLPAEPLQDKTLVVMNYFGIMDGQVARYVRDSSCRVIVDNSFAYFAPHIPGTYSIYECTKFLGVTNGAYLVGDIRCGRDLPVDVAYSRGSHLMKALELGTSGAYKDYYTNEQRVGSGAARMSLLTSRLLEGVDYQRVIRRRRENYAFLEANLPGEKLTVSPEAVPQCYPLVADVRIREALVGRKIFVPSYWRKCAEGGALNPVERKLAERVCCLPTDQRYTLEQMEYLLQVVETVL